MEIVFKKDKQKKPNPFKEGAKKLFEKVKHYRFPATFYYFLILIAIGVGFYMWMLVQNNFSLAYGGDYMAQYIPMGYHVWDYYHEWFRTGHFILFDQDIYLGVNSFGSNAYYGLFSPFNIIVILFPRAFVPQAMAITSIIKIACAGLFFSAYMKQAFKVKDNVARLCGIAYGFAGWGAFYLWYNNYQDVLVFFPLVLLGIENTIQKEKPWLLALGVFFLAISNYVLMVSYVICAFLYAMFRYFQTIRTRTIASNFKVLGLGFIGFAGGLAMSLIVFGPAFMATMASPKLELSGYKELLKGYWEKKKYKEFFDLLLSWKVAPDQHNRIIPERVYYPILEFFFPTTTCRSLPTLELYGWDFDDICVSLWCYVPFILFLVPALIQSFTEKKWTHIVGFALMVFALFTPVMYYLTVGLTNGYARWTLFVVAALIAYVGIYINKIPNVPTWHMHVGFIFAIMGMFASWFITRKLADTVVSNDPGFVQLGIGGLLLAGLTGYFGKTTKNKAVKSVGYVLLAIYFLVMLFVWFTSDMGLDMLSEKKSGELTYRFLENGINSTNIVFIAEMLYVAVVYVVLLLVRNTKAFVLLATLFVSAEAIAVGNFVTWGHGYDGGHNNGYDTNERFRYTLKKIEDSDKSFYRMYTSIGDGWSTNNAFMNGYGAASFFHSLYNFEVNDYTLWTGLRNGDKSVGGSYRNKIADIDNQLGIKYYVVSKKKTMQDYIDYYYPGSYMANVPWDFEEVKEFETNEYKVYKNSKLNDLGYAYDTVYNGELDKSSVNYDVRCVRNALALSTNAVASKEDCLEITNKHPDITVTDEKVKTLDEDSEHYKAVQYSHNVYHVGTWAKYYDFQKIADIPTTFTPISAYNYNSNETMKYFAFYTPRVDNQPLFKEGTALYIKAGFTGSIKYNFYFIDKDNKIFMMDAHDDDTTDNTSYMRGFYVKRDCYALAVCGKYYQSHVRSYSLSLYKEDVSDYRARWDKLNAQPITNVKYTADKFTFDTNYDAEKFVVTRVAFDAGWKLKATNNDTKQSEDLKVIKGNGGFVSFVAPKGNYSYTMVYETPYLKLSYVASAFSFMTFFGSLLGYHLYQEKKRNHHLDNLFREN